MPSLFTKNDIFAIENGIADKLFYNKIIPLLTYRPSNPAIRGLIRKKFNFLYI